MATRAPSVAAVERKLHMQLRERLATVGYNAVKFYKVFPPDRDGTVEVLFRGYIEGRHPIKVDALTALATEEQIQVRTGW